MQAASILIVEDEDIIAEDILDTLKGFGYELAGRASNGNDAISLAREEQPQLILMDVNIEGEMDGIDAARVIREFLDVPVVFLTSLGDSETLKRASVTDPSGYVLKPFQERELRAAIELAMLRASDSHEENEEAPSSSALTPVQRDIVSILKKIPHFSIFEVQDAESLAKASRVVEYCAGDPLVFEGEESSEGMLVISGRAIALKSSPNGKELIIELLPPGDPFGLFPTIDSHPHAYTLKAHTDSRIVWIPRKALLRVLSRYPEVYRDMLGDVFERLRSAHDISRALAHDLVEVRIASALLAILPKFTKTDNSACSIDMTRQELGEMIGATSETVIRVTKAMEREGILDLTTSGKILIRDAEALETICEDGKFYKKNK